MPWSVLLCKNVDGCHPEIANVLVQALTDGVLTERSGHRIYLSDAVVVLTAHALGGGVQEIGFAPPRPDGEPAVEAGAGRLRGAAERVELWQRDERIRVLGPLSQEPGAGSGSAS